MPTASERIRAAREAQATLVLNVESFELCARTNLAHAAAVMDADAARHRDAHEWVEACASENAAATLREVLMLDVGHYFDQRP